MLGNEDDDSMWPPLDFCILYQFLSVATQRDMPVPSDPSLK